MAKLTKFANNATNLHVEKMLIWLLINAHYEYTMNRESF